MENMKLRSLLLKLFRFVILSHKRVGGRVMKTSTKINIIVEYVLNMYLCIRHVHLIHFQIVIDM